VVIFFLSGQGARDTGHGAQGSEQTLSPESVVERSRNHGALNGVSRVVRHNPMFFTLTFRICTGSISSENLSRFVISFLIQSKSLFEAACFPDNNRLIFNATCDNILLIITVICYPSVIQHLINDNKQW